MNGHFINSLKCNESALLLSGHSERCDGPPTLHLPDSGHGEGHPVLVLRRRVTFPPDDVVDFPLDFQLHRVRIGGAVEKVPVDDQGGRVRAAGEQAQDGRRQIKHWTREQPFRGPLLMSESRRAH